MNSQIEESSDSLQKIEAECYDRNIELTIRKLERNANILLISCLQNRAKKIEDISARKAKLSVPEATLLR